MKALLDAISPWAGCISILCGWVALSGCGTTNTEVEGQRERIVSAQPVNCLVPTLHVYFERLPGSIYVSSYIHMASMTHTHNVDAIIIKETRNVLGAITANLTTRLAAMDQLGHVAAFPDGAHVLRLHASVKGGTTELMSSSLDWVLQDPEGRDLGSGNVEVEQEAFGGIMNLNNARLLWLSTLEELMVGLSQALESESSQPGDSGSDRP